MCGHRLRNVLPTAEGVAFFGRCVRQRDRFTEFHRDRIAIELAVHREGNFIAVDRPLGRDRHILSGHGRGDLLVPTGKGVAFLGRVSGSRDFRAVIRSDRIDRSAAIGVEGDRVLVDRPLGVHGAVAVNGRRVGRQHFAGAFLVISPSVEGITLAGERIIRQLRLYADSGLDRLSRRRLAEVRVQRDLRIDAPGAGHRRIVFDLDRLTADCVNRQARQIAQREQLIAFCVQHRDLCSQRIIGLGGSAAGTERSLHDRAIANHDLARAVRLHNACEGGVVLDGQPAVDEQVAPQTGQSCGIGGLSALGHRRENVKNQQFAAFLHQGGGTLFHRNRGAG